MKNGRIRFCHLNWQNSNKSPKSSSLTHQWIQRLQAQLWREMCGEYFDTLIGSPFHIAITVRVRFHYFHYRQLRVIHKSWRLILTANCQYDKSVLWNVLYIYKINPLKTNQISLSVDSAAFLKSTCSTESSQSNMSRRVRRIPLKFSSHNVKLPSRVIRRRCVIAVTFSSTLAVCCKS